MKIIIASGYFDPIHIGHIEYLKLAKELGDKLIVILNNDAQCILKKGQPFMLQDERKAILESLKYVDEVFDSIDNEKFIDENGRKHVPISNSIKAIAEKYKGNEIIFAKGGDRLASEIPEAKICKELGIKIVDNLGKKIQSSSNLTGLKEVK
jgi:cytidyltransferase-like protein